MYSPSLQHVAAQPFRFKRFRIEQAGAAHPAGTDGVLLGAWTDIRSPRRILDIGTGTGLVALMLAQRTENVPDVAITGVELHAESVDCARGNFQQSPWADRLEAVNMPIQDFARQTKEQFDLITCNPPFFTETIVSPDTVRRLGRNTHTLPQADLLEAAGKLLAPAGLFCVILPVQEGRRLCEWACLRGLYCTKETAVYTRAGKPCERLLLRLERNPYPFSRSELHIYQTQETYTPEFRALTHTFYLAF